MTVLVFAMLSKVPEKQDIDEDRARLDDYLRGLGERDASSWDSDTLQRLEAALAERRARKA